MFNGDKSPYWQIRAIDPRAFQILALSCYATLAVKFGAFERPSSWVFDIVLLGVVIDILLGRVWFKQIKFPFTPVIAALATSILIDTPHYGIYLIAIAFAVFSKAFLTADRKHLLNPANAGVVLVLLAFPGLVAGAPKAFNFDTWLYVLFTVVGIFVSSYAKVLPIAIAWVFSFGFFAILRSWIGHVPLSLAFLPMLAPSFFVFTFHMITDPGTAPGSLRGRIFYTFAVAGIDAIMRHQFVGFSNFYALTIVCLAMPWVRAMNSNWLGSFRKLATTSSLVWALPLFTGLGFYKSWSESRVNYQDTRDRQPSNFQEPPNFKRVNKPLGVRFHVNDPDADAKLKNQLRLQWVGPGVTVRDFNGDGWMDMFLFDSNQRVGSNQLLINNQGKGFVDHAESWGLKKFTGKIIPQAVTPFDYDNDGKVDLLVTGPGCLQLYRNLGGRFENTTNAAGFEKDCRNSIVALPVDYNRDGWMDLYVARFFPAEIDLEKVENLFYFGPDNFGHAKNGGRDTVYLNRRGNFTEDPTVFTEPYGTWTWDVGLADIMGTGKPILVTGNDFGDDFYLELGDQKFRDITDEITIRDDRSSMNVSFGHWESDRPMVYLTNVYDLQHKVRGNFMWEFDPASNRLVDKQLEREGGKCDWAWGAGFADFNLDGHQDIYVANGMVTRSSKAAFKKKDANYFKLMSTGNVPSSVLAQGPSSESLFRYLDDQKDFGAHQVDCLFLKDAKNARYRYATGGSPDIEVWDGRAVALIDYDNNGAMDLLISTQGSPYVMLENQINSTGRMLNWVGFEIISPQNLSMGARFETKHQGVSRYHWYQNGKTGFLAFSDPRIHFGLEPAKTSDEVTKVELTVKWADGLEQNFGPFAPGAYYKIQREK